LILKNSLNKKAAIKLQQLFLHQQKTISMYKRPFSKRNSKSFIAL